MEVFFCLLFRRSELRDICQASQNEDVLLALMETFDLRCGVHLFCQVLTRTKTVVQVYIWASFFLEELMLNICMGIGMLQLHKNAPFHPELQQFPILHVKYFDIFYLTCSFTAMIPASLEGLIRTHFEEK